MALHEHRLAMGLFGGVALVWLASLGFLLHRAALPETASGDMLAVFRPGTAQDDALFALLNAGGTPIRQTATGFVWIVTDSEPGLVGRLKKEGMVAAYRPLPFTPTVAGCFALPEGVERLPRK